MRFLIALLAGAVFAQSPEVTKQMKERANLRGQRYCEILLVNQHGLSAEAKVYNTLGLNECPDDQWNVLDAKQIAKEKGVSRAVKNGPRYFVMDRNGLMSPAGGVEHFEGMDMGALATLELKLKMLLNRQPYTENTVERESQYVYDAGKDVYELLAPGGTRYIMQSYSLEIDKTLNQEALTNLSSRLKLPKGWQYKARKLDQELVIRNSGSQAHVLQDNLQNSYQRVN